MERLKREQQEQQNEITRSQHVLSSLRSEVDQQRAWEASKRDAEFAQKYDI